MTRHLLFRHLFAATCLVTGLLSVPSAFSQTTASAPTTAPAEAPTDLPRTAPGDEIVELSPFVVEAPRDNSYGVLNSTSITSFKTELTKLPISADIITSAFMDDTNSTTLENMLRDYSAGSGTGSAAGDVGGIPINQPMDRGGGDSVSAGVQLRGLGAAVVKQDGFMLPSPAGTGLNSNFDVERVEVIFGPQSLLYGNGGGGGVVNTISKQARFGRRPTGSLKLKMDQYGHHLAQLDYSVGNKRAAFLFTILHQELGDNRDFIGGPLQGIYGQFAVKLGNTTLRLSGKRTELDRFGQQGITLNATNTTFDARHGQNIRYLLASGQMEASATGASGAGVIGNGHVTWDNVDSYGGNMKQELTTATLVSLIAETKWRPWLTTQLSAGMQEKESRVGYAGLTFFAPTVTANLFPGQWAIGTAGSTGNAGAQQPSDSRSLRFSALLTNDLFNGRAHSETIIGAEYTKGNYANEATAYYEADANFDPILTSTGARIRLNSPNPSFSVQNGPLQYPWYEVGTRQITYNGKNYVLQVQNITDPALVGPNNPQGVTNTSLFIHGRGISSGLFAVNYTKWMDERLTTLTGVRYVDVESRQYASAARPAILAAAKNVSFSVGANYALNSWLRPYFALSDSYNLPSQILTLVSDPYGDPLPVSHSFGQEIGIKLGTDKWKISGSIAAFAVQAMDEPYNIPSQLRDHINPAGLNGRHLGATGVQIKVDRKSAGLQVALTAQPTRNWSMRLSAAMIKGTIGTDTSYKPLYNDQFHTNSLGQVTYANGTVVYVRTSGTAAQLNVPGTAANAGYIPLTIAKLSTPGDLHYANPDPTTGRLGASAGRNVLNYAASPNGLIRTGVSGLPISALQITGITPVDEIVTSRAGDRTTGYPELSMNFTNMYTVPSGVLKGFRIGGTANLAWRRGDYYYYPTGYTPVASRELFSRPPTVLFNLIAGYQHKFNKVTWSVQVNVNNVFNNYDILIRPNNLNGYSGINNALFSNQPREYTFSSTFKF